MSRAVGGMLCPLCGKYTLFTVRRILLPHRGEVSKLIGSGFMECRATGFSEDRAALMRENKDAGRHPYRNEDGSWFLEGRS